jgi:hypothetical protein
MKLIIIAFNIFDDFEGKYGVFKLMREMDIRYCMYRYRILYLEIVGFRIIFVAFEESRRRNNLPVLSEKTQQFT